MASAGIATGAAMTQRAMAKARMAKRVNLNIMKEY
jgi:hypothetical protein